MTLLERSKRGVCLTSAGEQVLPFLRKVLNDHAELEGQICRINGIETGVVRIGTFASVAIHWLPNIFSALQRDYPGFGYEMLLGDYDEVERWIGEGRVDCGFLRLPSAKSLCAHPLYRDELLVVVPCGHQLADAAAFPLSALSAEPFIRLEEGRDYELTAALDAMGVHPNVKYTAREDRTILAMVSKGLGISLLPELMVRRSPYPVAACHAPERFYRNIGIAVKDEKAQSASTRRFVDYVRRWVAENGED